MSSLKENTTSDNKRETCTAEDVKLILGSIPDDYNLKWSTYSAVLIQFQGYQRSNSVLGVLFKDLNIIYN